MVSRSISPGYLPYFSPFLHSTSSLSVSWEYLALADGAAGFNGDSSGPRLLRIPRPHKLSTYKGLSPAMAGLPRPFYFHFVFDARSYNPNAAVTALVWASPRSLATTYGITFVFSS